MSQVEAFGTLCSGFEQRRVKQFYTAFFPEMLSCDFESNGTCVKSCDEWYESVLALVYVVTSKVATPKTATFAAPVSLVVKFKLL
jgi:hypothetical protein